MMNKQEAEERGQALLKRMKGKGWKLRVHENIGWHYNVWNGPAAVYAIRKWDEWLRQYARFVELGEVDGDAIKFKQSQAILLDAMLASQEDVAFDRKFQQLRESLSRCIRYRPANRAGRSNRSC